MQYSLSINDSLQVGSVQINVLEVWHDSVKLAINDPGAFPSYREVILHVNSDDDGAEDEFSTFESSEIEVCSEFALPVV